MSLKGGYLSMPTRLINDSSYFFVLFLKILSDLQCITSLSSSLYVFAPLHLRVRLPTFWEHLFKLKQIYVVHLLLKNGSCYYVYVTSLSLPRLDHVIRWCDYISLISLHLCVYNQIGNSEYVFVSLQHYQIGK